MPETVPTMTSDRSVRGWHQGSAFVRATNQAAGVGFGRPLGGSTGEAGCTATEAGHAQRPSRGHCDQVARLQVRHKKQETSIPNASQLSFHETPQRNPPPNGQRPPEVLVLAPEYFSARWQMMVFGSMKLFFLTWFCLTHHHWLVCACWGSLGHSLFRGHGMARAGGRRCGMGGAPLARIARGRPRP